MSEINQKFQHKIDGGVYRNKQKFNELQKEEKDDIEACDIRKTIYIWNK